MLEKRWLTGTYILSHPLYLKRGLGSNCDRSIIIIEPYCHTTQNPHCIIEFASAKLTNGVLWVFPW